MLKIFNENFDTSYRGAFLRGLTSSFFAHGVGFVLNLWTVATCVRSLGSGYGAWIAGYALLSMLGFFELGMGPFIMRQTATLRVRGAARQDWAALYSTVVSAYFAIAFMTWLLGYSVAPFVARLVESDPMARLSLVPALRWGALQVALAQLGIWRSFAVGAQKLEVFGLLSIIEALTLALSTNLLLFFWPTVKVLPFAMMISVLSWILAAYPFVPKEIREGFWPLQRPSRETFKSLLAYCLPMTLSKFCYFVRERTDEPLAARFLGKEAVVMYVVTQKLIRSIPFMLIGSVNSLAFAPLSALIAEGDKEGLRRLVLHFLRAGIIFSFGAAAFVWAMNPVFVNLWVGPRHYGGDRLSLIFSSWILLEVFSRGFSYFLYAAGKNRLMMAAQAAEAALNLVFSIVLVRWFGLVGLAMGTAIAAVLTTSWFIPRTVFQMVGMTRKDLKFLVAEGWLLRAVLFSSAIVAGRFFSAAGAWPIQVLVPSLCGILSGLLLFGSEFTQFIKGWVLQDHHAAATRPVCKNPG